MPNNWRGTELKYKNCGKIWEVYIKSDNKPLVRSVFISSEFLSQICYFNYAIKDCMMKRVLIHMARGQILTSNFEENWEVNMWNHDVTYRSIRKWSVSLYFMEGPQSYFQEAYLEEYLINIQNLLQIFKYIWTDF